MTTTRLQRRALTVVERPANALYSTRKASLIERLRGMLWRINFRINRHLMRGWAWIDEDAPQPKIRKITTTIRYE